MNLPGQHPPYMSSETAPDLSNFSSYPGAIDLGPSSLGAVEGTWRGGGYDDRDSGEYLDIGNPYATDRLAVDKAAPPCIDDDAIAVGDIDEQVPNQVRARNDPTRVVAGIMNRRKFLDPYLREELDETEDRRWWGRHET